MNVKYTKAYLSKLEDLFSESNYTLRYEKGNFKSGYCVLNETNIVIVNKYYSLEGKVNCLIEILRQINVNKEEFTEKSYQLFNELTQTKLKI